MAKRPASTSPFAHLAAANAEDDDDKKKPDAKAEGEDEEDDDDEGDEKDTKSNRSKAKKTKAEDDGDSDDEDDESDDQAKAARSRERARCAAIFAAPSAARNLQAAAHLAFNTNLPRSQAVGLLNSLTPASQAAKADPKSLRDRMQGSPFSGVKQEASAASAPVRPGAGLVAAQSARGK